MQVEFKENSMLLIPQTPVEKESIQKLFPKENHQASKRVKSKQFVDKFGCVVGDHYLEVKGFKKSESEGE
jgi:hypothetical protein